MLEKMSDFFENRLDVYDEHMLNDIESAREFYPFTAKELPKTENCRILDLGCGTGLELEEYFKINPSAKVTGIDLSEKMLCALKAKFPEKEITLVLGSYFKIPLGGCVFDAAVSVESLHHYEKRQKVKLYKKIHRTLKDNGYFILTDYFAASCAEERKKRKSYLELKEKEGLSDREIYHYDTPLTPSHEIEALKAAGFSSVEILKSWGQTYTIKAVK